jgi:competence protein ComGC
MMKSWRPTLQYPTVLRSERGFTLVEMIITLGLMMMFLLVLTDLMTSAFNVQNESGANAWVATDGQAILQRLSYDVSRASAISTPTTLGGTSASLVLVIGGANYTYTSTGGNLQLTGPSSTFNLNTDKTTVPSISFTRLGDAGRPDTVRATFTITSTTKSNGAPVTSTFTTTAGRR